MVFRLIFVLKNKIEHPMFLLQVIGFYSHPIYSMISLSETENVPCPKFKNKVGGQLPPPPSKSAQYNFRI